MKKNQNIESTNKQKEDKSQSTEVQVEDACCIESDAVRKTNRLHVSSSVSIILKLNFKIIRLAFQAAC